MARREIKMEELIEVLYQYHSGRNISQIKRSLGIDRKTIKKYIELAKHCGFSRDIEIKPELYYMRLAYRIQKRLKTPLSSTPSFKKTSLYQHKITKLLKRKCMTEKQVYRILKRDCGYGLSYSSFKRYMRIKYSKRPKGCLRIEVEAGEEAQVDFGSAGKMVDPETGRLRKAHMFIMTLSYSRLHYVKFVFDQSQRTWVKCHIDAFKFFGGVPERIVLDNLKSGVLKPHTYDPVFNKSYAECAKHYGFIIDPAKIRKPEHKGKVERKVPVVRGQFLTYYDAPVDITTANKEVCDWCLYGYGGEEHGTTKRKPHEVFKLEEQTRLKSLPQEDFDIPLWKRARVHRDHHIVFAKNYYSLPTRYIGKKVWVRGGLYRVHIFYDGELIKTHTRAKGCGTWMTDKGDYPPEKSRYLMKSTSYYQKEASKYGKYVCRLVTKIMTERAYRNLRKVEAIFKLAERYGKEAINLTCKRCLHYEDYKMNTIKRILKKKLYNLPSEEEVMEGLTSSSQKGLSFIRPSEYFVHREGIL